MDEIDAEFTNPILLVQDPEIENFRRPFARGTEDLVTRISPGDVLVSPSGVRGYVSGRSWSSPRCVVFVITGDQENEIVEMETKALAGFRTDDGRLVSPAAAVV